MEDMRLLLQQDAIRLGLIGLVGYPVTNHLFSQKAEEHLGARLCRVALGLWRRSFHNMPEPLPQRMSFVIYFRYLQPPGQIRHVATHHNGIIRRIHALQGTSVQLIEGSRASGLGALALESETDVQTASIQVRRVGVESAAAIKQARRQLLENG